LEPRDDGWRVSDGLWERIEPLLPPRPRHPLGCHRPRVSDRAALDAILFVLRTGCQWSALSQTRICSKSSAYRRFREWAASGVFERLWQHLLDDPETPLDWAWLALDGQIVKAPKGAVKRRVRIPLTERNTARNQVSSPTRPGYRSAS